MPSSGSSQSGRVAFTVFYVLPLLATAAALCVVGLAELAVALVVIEAIVLAVMAVVRRRPAPDRSVPTQSRPWLVPALMVGALLVMVGIALVASRSG